MHAVAIWWCCVVWFQLMVVLQWGPFQNRLVVCIWYLNWLLLLFRCVENCLCLFGSHCSLKMLFRFSFFMPCELMTMRGSIFYIYVYECMSVGTPGSYIVLDDSEGVWGIGVLVGVVIHLWYSLFCRECSVFGRVLVPLIEAFFFFLDSLSIYVFDEVFYCVCVASGISNFSYCLWIQFWFYLRQGLVSRLLFASSTIPSLPCGLGIRIQPTLALVRVVRVD